MERISTARRRRRLVPCALALAALLGLTLALGGGGARAGHGAVFNVNSTLDQPDASPGDGACSSTPSGVCTLRAAIEEVNVHGSGNINLPAGRFVLGAQLVITKSPTIVGAGSGRTIIDGNNDHRVFDIADGAFVYIGRVSIENGEGEMSVAFPGHVHGGGIHNHGRLILVDSTLRFNAPMPGSTGGAMTNAGTGVATLVNVTIRTNVAANGGGIENLGELSLYNVTIAWNTAINASVGAGIYNNNGGKPLIIKNTLLTNNYSGGNLLNCAGLPNTAATNHGNLSNDATCGFTAADSNVDAGLGAFDFDNHTYPLLAGGAAVDGGINDAGVCPSADQIGAPRPQDGNGNGVATCDVGATERQAPSTPTSTATSTATAGPSPTPTSTVEAAPATDIRIFAPLVVGP
ncbi:MAG: hypothetical protein RLZZ387_1339 [Chloroflexota bacterium]